MSDSNWPPDDYKSTALPNELTRHLEFSTIFKHLENLKRSLQYLKKLGYWIYGLDNNSNQNNTQIDFPKKCVLVLGSEGRGIREINKKECDNLFALPSQPNKSYGIDSLNVSTACAIALYEHFKKYN